MLTEAAQALIQDAHVMAKKAWFEINGCQTCMGSGTVSRNCSDTMDYSDYRTFPCHHRCFDCKGRAVIWNNRDCSACYGKSQCTAKETGRFVETESYRKADQLAKTYDLRIGVWARSYTTRGKSIGLSGIIIETDTVSYGYHNRQNTFLVVNEEGRRGWVSEDRLATEPWEADRAFALRLKLAKTSKEVKDLQSLATNKNQEESAMIRYDQLAEKEVQVEESDYVFWKKNGDIWCVKGSGLKLGKVPARSKDGRIQWVDVKKIEKGFGYL